ncbi:hypothetical protein [Fodinicola feengrottensis]|uniref:hypothetical protein n=1 Tax=Fodinicola feengrottensis TaxID=435914 RepID=UPI0031E3DE1C
MTTTATRAGARPDRGTRRDLLAVGAVGALVAVAAGVGWLLIDFSVGPNGRGPYTGWPPLWAQWAPHVGPGTVPALALAALVVVKGPEWAARLSWKRLLWVAYATAAGWIFFLALVDGWGDGIQGRLERQPEYLSAVPKIRDIGAFLAHFTDGIVAGPHQWTEHVAGHPPGVTLIFVLLQRVGLGGGGIAGLLCIFAGASACIAVAVTLRALGAEKVARTALPFGVLFPGAIWMGVSADAIFAAVVAWGVAAFAVGAVGRGRWREVYSLGGGLLLGYGLYLSYGLVLAGVVPLAVALITRRIRPLLIAGLGVVAVVVAFSATGFLWWQGIALVHVRYYQGIATMRPYWYWVWANFAALALVIGPATVAGLRRVRLSRGSTFAQLKPPPLLQSESDCNDRMGAAVVLAGAAVLAVVLADLSGLSKAEVERIWLPFAVWIVPVCAALPVRKTRWWLAAQAGLALAVNHLLATGW